MGFFVYKSPVHSQLRGDLFLQSIRSFLTQHPCFTHQSVAFPNVQPAILVLFGDSEAHFLILLTIRLLVVPGFFVLWLIIIV
jgi:hypothetical protein